VLQKLQDLAKDWKTYASMLVSAFGAANAYLHFFMPIAPDLRLRATVFVFLLPFIGIGITISRALARKHAGQEYRNWGGWVAGISTAVGFAGWVAYGPIVKYFENHSANPGVSQWFDALQVGAYALPFLCWGIAVSALLSTLI
jgi:hypothetical protein